MIFLQKVSKPTKTSKKCHSFYNTVSLKKPHSFFYEPQLTQHYKKYTPATQLKTCFWLVSEKHLHGTISRRPRTAFLKPLKIKCLCIPVNLQISVNFLYSRKSRDVENFHLVQGCIISFRQLAVWGS